jgi:hypothetical protein
MIWLLIVLVFGFTRLYNLDLIPVFADEAIYIRWAQLLAYDWRHLFVPLTDGKTPLFMWLLAPLLRLGFDPLLTGRVLSAVSGLLGVVGIYKLSQKLFGGILGDILPVPAFLRPDEPDRQFVDDFNRLVGVFRFWSRFRFGRGRGLMGEAVGLKFAPVDPAVSLKSLEKTPCFRRDRPSFL